MFCDYNYFVVSNSVVPENRIHVSHDKNSSEHHVQVLARRHWLMAEALICQDMQAFLSIAFRSTCKRGVVCILVTNIKLLCELLQYIPM